MSSEKGQIVDMIELPTEPPFDRDTKKKSHQSSFSMYFFFQHCRLIKIWDLITLALVFYSPSIVSKVEAKLNSAFVVLEGAASTNLKISPTGSASSIFISFFPFHVFTLLKSV